jgi:hypothetical protein
MASKMLATLCTLFSLIFAIFSRSKKVARCLTQIWCGINVGGCPGNLRAGFHLSESEDTKNDGGKCLELVSHVFQ